MVAHDTDHFRFPTHLLTRFIRDFDRFHPQGLKASRVVLATISWFGNYPTRPFSGMTLLAPFPLLTTCSRLSPRQCRVILPVVISSSSLPPFLVLMPLTSHTLLSPRHALVCFLGPSFVVFTPEAHALVIFPFSPLPTLLSPTLFPVPTPCRSLGPPPSATLLNPLASRFPTLDPPFSLSPRPPHPSVAICRGGQRLQERRFLSR
jgi:hypothetical protein